MYLVEEGVEGVGLHYIEAHVLDRLLRLSGMPCVELVAPWDGNDPHAGARVLIGYVDLGQVN
ncbi:MAG: hypothetical protein ACKPKO_37585, partial [Candidatus Fonsibacter sp.]